MNENYTQSFNPSLSPEDSPEEKDGLFAEGEVEQIKEGGDNKPVRRTMDDNKIADLVRKAVAEALSTDKQEEGVSYNVHELKSTIKSALYETLKGTNSMGAEEETSVEPWTKTSLREKDSHGAVRVIKEPGTGYQPTEKDTKLDRDLMDHQSRAEKKERGEKTYFTPHGGEIDKVKLKSSIYEALKNITPASSSKLVTPDLNHPDIANDPVSKEVEGDRIHQVSDDGFKNVLVPPEKQGTGHDLNQKLNTDPGTQWERDRQVRKDRQ